MRKNLTAILGGLGLILATLLIAWWLCPQESPQRVEHQSSPLSAPSAPSFSNQASSLVEFQRYTDTLLTQVPSASQLRAEDVEAHAAPLVVLQFAPKLAHVHDVMRADSRNIAVGLKFFERCALDNKALVTIRSVCFRLFRRWDPQTDVPVTDEIADISQHLPGDDL